MASQRHGTRFHSEGLWARISELAEGKQRALVAVPFFGQGGAKMLPLRSESCLVVNCSEAAARAGLVCPRELLKLQRQGVRIFSQPDLHAKVFVFGRRAIVGSANVSKHSRDRLVEAGFETSNRSLVRACRLFVAELASDEVGPEWLTHLARVYKPPRSPGTRPGPKRKGKRPKKRPLAWVVGLKVANWSRAEEDAAGRALPKAKRRIRDSDNFKIEQFEWPGGDSARFGAGDLVFQLVGRKKRSWKLHPAGRIVHLEKFRTRGGTGVIVSLETPKRRRARAFLAAYQALGNPSELRGAEIHVKSIASKALFSRLERLWK